MSELVSYRVEHDIAVIAVNNPPVNALCLGMPEGICEGVETAERDPSVKAIVLIGEGRTFIAGVDIRSFGKAIDTERRKRGGFHPLLSKLEDSPKHVVCAIHGTALGGGLEVAMACHARIADSSARVGQPEVKLGIIPGAAGTQRLPCLAGLLKAAEMCAFGEMISSTEAKECGIVDRITEGDLLAGAQAFAREIVASDEPPRKTRDLTISSEDSKAEEATMSRLRASVKRKSRGAKAPLKAIEAVEAAILPFPEGVEVENRIFEELYDTVESRNMIHVFFGERTVRKIPNLPRDTKTYPINRAAVIGGGTMGGGITMSFVNAGIPVTLVEVDRERLEKGMETIRSNYARSLKSGRFTETQVEKRIARITPTVSYGDLSDVDIVIEAVFEEMELKKRVFAEIDEVAPPHAILASNTSALDIDEIASATNRPDQVIGTHYFNPANVMRLTEIVHGAQTSKEAIATCMAIARRLNKIGVVVGNCNGFVANRMMDPYGRECQYMAEEGAKIHEIDKELVEFGMAMGAFAMWDLAGLDIASRILNEEGESSMPGERPLRAGDRLGDMGRWGQKTNAGWYRYEPGSRAPIPDPEVEAILAECAKDAGIEQRAIGPQEMIERPLYALINEAARILEEGMALRSVDIDIIAIYGFSPRTEGARCGMPTLWVWRRSYSASPNSSADTVPGGNPRRSSNSSPNKANHSPTLIKRECLGRSSDGRMDYDLLLEKRMGCSGMRKHFVLENAEILKSNLIRWVSCRRRHD